MSVMKIGFIGTGKISSAVVEAICRSDIPEYKILLSPRNKDMSEKLASKFENVSRQKSNQDVINKSHLVFLALRPADYQKVLADLSFREDHTIISLIPYLGLSELKGFVSPARQLSRAIPLPTTIYHVCPIPVYQPTTKVMELLNRIGQPLKINSENELHTIWTLTCLITPFYDLMTTLSTWAADNAIDINLANKYVADMIHSLAFAASQSEKPDFAALSHHAATPGGMNEKTGKEISESGAHGAYVKAADIILESFRDVTREPKK